VTAEVRSYERAVHEADLTLRDRCRHGGECRRCNDIFGRTPMTKARRYSASVTRSPVPVTLSSTVTPR